MKRKNSVPIGFVDFDRLPDGAFVRIQAVKMLYGEISTASVWRNSGKSIPAPYKLTSGVTAWNVGELRKSLATKPHAITQKRSADAEREEGVEGAFCSFDASTPSLSTEEKDEHVEARSCLSLSKRSVKEHKQPDLQRVQHRGDCIK